MFVKFGEKIEGRIENTGLIPECFTFPCRIEHVYYFALVQRASRHFARSDQINLVSLHLRNLHLPSLNSSWAHLPSFILSLPYSSSHYLHVLPTSPSLLPPVIQPVLCASCQPLAFLLPQCPHSSLSRRSQTPSFSDPAHLTITPLPFHLNCPLYSPK